MPLTKNFKKIIFLYFWTTILSVLGVVCLSMDSSLLANQVRVASSTINKQFKDMKLDVVETYLENGLKIILKEDHSVPLVTVGCWYRIGSQMAGRRSTGISHFVEHMTFKGSEQLLRKNKQWNSDYTAAYPNGYTFLDQTGYFSTVISSKLESALRLEAHRMQLGEFDQLQVNNERRLIMSELRASDRNPKLALDQNIVAAAFKLHPYRWPILGWPQDVQQLDAIEISKHYSDYYSPNNAILVIVGDFQTENVLSLINQFFGPISRKLLPSLTPVFEPEQEGEKRLRITRPGKVSYIQLAYHSPDILNDDFYVLLVIDALLCGAKGLNVWSGPWNDSALRTSRLYQSLIDTQLVTHVNSSLVPTRDPYLYKLSLTLPDSSHLRLSEDTVDFELENIKDTQVSDDDLYRAKNQLWTRFYLDQSSVYKIAHQLGYFESIASFTILENFAEKIQRVSKLDVQRVARKVFKKKSRTIGWFVPEFSKNNVAVEDLSAQSGKFDLKKLSSADELVFSNVFESVDKKRLKHHPQVARWSFAGEGVHNSLTDSHPVPEISGDKIIDPTQSIGSSWNSKRQVFPNGVVVLTAHNPAHNSFSLKLVVKGGAFRDLDDQPGLANLTGRMVPSGSKKSFFPVHEMESLGLLLRTKTNYFSTTFELQGLKENLPKAIELIALMVRNANFSMKEFNKEKKIVLNELVQENLNDEQIVELLLRQNIFPRGHAFRQSIKGNTESVGILLKSDVDHFYRKFYRPDQLILAISSGYQVDKIIALTHRYFGDWENNGLVDPVVINSVATSLKHTPQFIPAENKSLCKLVYGLPGVLRNEPDYLPLILLSQILNLEGREGGRIRGQNEFVSRNFLSLETVLKNGLFVIEIGISPDQEESSLKFIKERIEIIKDQGFTPKELEFSKKVLLNSLLIKLSSKAGLNDSMINAEWMGLQKNGLEKLIQLIRSITLEQLIDIARTRLFFDQASLVRVGSSCSSSNTDLKVN